MNNIKKKDPTQNSLLKNLKIKHSTQEFVELEEVLANIAITKHGTFLAIVEVFPTNFDLLSQEEQDYKIRKFGALINSLDFNLQIVIDTKKLFVSEYINYLEKIDITGHPKGLQRMFKIYKQFITNIITKQKVFKKRFFLIIPYTSGVSYSITMSINRKQQLITQAINFLKPKITHIISMVKTMGLDAKQLKTAEIIKYYYQVYNPDKKTIPIQDHVIELNN